MKGRNIWIALLICLITFALISGCAPARRPLTPENQNQIAPRTQQPGFQDGTITQQTTNAQAKANRIARACDAVPGVEKATVVVSGNTCYVGLDVEGNLEKGETESVEQACLDKAIAADPSIKRCVVSSDADTVSRLKGIYQGVRTGTPISSFGNELEEIGRRIVPKTKG